MEWNTAIYTLSFAEYRLSYGPLLQKRPIILSILLTVATPYEYCVARSSSESKASLAAGNLNMSSHELLNRLSQRTRVRERHGDRA